MYAPTSLNWLADALEPLHAAFGDELRLSREGSAARWSYGERAAVVELGKADRIAAHFLDAAAIDAISGQPSIPVYRSTNHGYALTHVGCERLVSDMVAFFSGTREPYFTFIAAD